MFVGWKDGRTWIDPLHAIWKGLVGDEVIAAPAWVGDYTVGRDDCREDDGEKSRRPHVCDLCMV